MPDVTTKRVQRFLDDDFSAISIGEAADRIGAIPRVNEAWQILKPTRSHALTAGVRERRAVEGRIHVTKAMC